MHLVVLAGSFVLYVVVFFLSTSVFHTCMSWTVFYERLSSISVLDYALFSFLSSLFWLPHYMFFYVVWGKPSRTLKIIHIPDQAIPSIPSR